MKTPSLKRAAKRHPLESADKKQDVKPVEKKGNFFSGLLADFAAGLTVIAKLFTTAIADMSVCAMIACGCVPFSLVTLVNLLGVGADNDAVDILFVLGMPCLFAVGMWCVFATWILRWLNRQIAKIFDWLSRLGSKVSGEK